MYCAFRKTMIYLIYKLRKVVDYEMKKYLKNRIMPMIFKNPQMSYAEMQMPLAMFSLLMIIIIGGIAQSVVNDFRQRNIDELHVNTYDSCRIIGMITDVVDGEHIQQYMCKTIADTDGETSQIILIDEREIFTDYTHINQKIRIMREPVILTNQLPYTEYYRTYTTKTP